VTTDETGGKWRQQLVPAEIGFEQPSEAYQVPVASFQKKSVVFHQPGPIPVLFQKM